MPAPRSAKPREPSDTRIESTAATEVENTGDLTGEIVAERYAVERLLGEGGIGRVWLARHLQLNRLVALKVLHPWLGHRREMVQRFEREAQATSLMNHPGCVMVYDFGTWREQLYIVMEYIVGVSLADVLERDRRLPPAEVCDIGAQLCDVLAEAHKHDLLHRDIKPENILVTEDSDGSRRVKVVDFGLAFLLGEQENRLTREGTVAGTPAYMAPEQALNRHLDGRTDIYAAGCVLYELLSGLQPFSGENSFEVLQRQIYDRPTPLSRHLPGQIPEALERLVMRCLEKKPSLRPASATELAAALREALNPDQGLRTGQLDATKTRVERALTTGPKPRPVAAPPVSNALPTGTTPPAVAVWQSNAGLTFADTAQAVLGPANFPLDVFDHLPDVLSASVIVADLRGLDGVTARERLREAVTHPDDLPVVAIGSDDDFDLMSDALTAGAAEFVGPTVLSTLPRRILKAARKARTRPC